MMRLTREDEERLTASIPAMAYYYDTPLLESGAFYVTEAAAQDWEKLADGDTGMHIRLRLIGGNVKVWLMKGTKALAETRAENGPPLGDAVEKMIRETLEKETRDATI